MTTSRSLSGIKGSCFDIRIEYRDTLLIIHLPYIEKMTRDIFVEMKIMLEDWHQFLQNTQYKTIWAAVSPDDQKIRKLLQMLNFSFKGEAEGMDIYCYGE